MKVHTCPKCGTTARNESQLEKKFGWRVTSSVGYVPQSWCKECRNKPKTKLTPTQLIERATEAAKDVSLNRAIMQGMNRDDLKSEYAKHFPGDTNKDRRSYRFMFSKLERKLRR